MNTNEVLKLALEALENWVEYFPQNVDDIDKKAITSLREELEKPDFWEGYVPEPVKPATEESSATQAQQALDKKAENARELGLDYEPAQQEPVAIVDANDEGYWAEILPDRSVKVGQLLYTSPPAQRTWVSLTDEQMLAIVHYSQLDNARAIEAKLKEKNA